MSEAVCIGISVFDLLFGYASPEIFTRELTLADRFRFSVGGDALNQAARISLLGHRVSLMTRVGDDLFGRHIIDAARQRNVETEDIFVDADTPTTVTIVLVQKDGQRIFLSTRGASKRFSRDCINFDKIKRAKAVSIASAFHARELDACAKEVFSLAKGHGAMTFLDFIGIADGGALADMRSAFGYLDYALPNYEEASNLTGEKELDKIAEAYLEMGVGKVIVKLGAEGCFYADRKESGMVPGYPVECADTTGAGDNFAGGFISAKLEGKSDLDALAYANAVGAISVQSYGGQARILKEDVEGFLRAYQG